MDDAQPYLDALHGSLDRLVDLVTTLREPGYEAPSYDPGWSIAHVLSHLGSQAEIFDLILVAGLTGGAPPAREAFAPIWDAWDAKDPAAQVADSLAATAAMLARVDALSDDERARFSVAMFGMQLDLAGVLRMRLSELALHTWDVEVTVDPGAVVPDVAAELLVDQALRLASRVGHPLEGHGPVLLATRAPVRRLELRVDPEVEFADAVEGQAPHGELAGESLLRLIAGRLDADHVPASVTLDADVLDDLRRVFTGY